MVSPLVCCSVFLLLLALFFSPSLSLKIDHERRRTESLITFNHKTHFTHEIQMMAEDIQIYVSAPVCTLPPPIRLFITFSGCLALEEEKYIVVVYSHRSENTHIQYSSVMREQL